MGVAGEKKLNDKYSDSMPEGLCIKITNPKGFIISGREIIYLLNKNLILK